MAGDTSRSETRQAGLGGHEEGVIGVYEGVKKSSLPLWKRGRTVQSDHATFSDFRGFEDENNSDNKNRFNTSAS